MISIGENKAVICKDDFHPAQLYKGNKKIAGYETAEFGGEGSAIFTGCYNDKIYSAVFEGNSVQDGTPAPETPIGIQSVGELVSEGDYAEKYKVPVTVYGEEGQKQSFDIYLDEPLRKIGDYADYIDFEKGVVVRNIAKRIFRGTESWKYDVATNKNTLSLSIRNSNISSALDANAVNALSNRLIGKSWEAVWSNYYKAAGSVSLYTGVAITFSKGDKTIDYRVSPYSELPTVEEWKAQLAVWYDEGDPFTVWHVLPTEEEETELPTLPTIKGATTIEIGTSVTANLKGKYKKNEELNKEE